MRETNLGNSNTQEDIKYSIKYKNVSERGNSLQVNGSFCEFPDVSMQYYGNANPVVVKVGS